MGKVKVKMELEFWYDPETNEYEPISNKVIDNKKETKPSKKDDGSSDPEIILEDNKLVLNSRAVEVLDAEFDDRITIKYQKVDGKTVPVIAKSATFGTSGGNKLTKSNTVSYRGKANDKLSEYGSEFKLSKKDEGIYILIGDKTPDEEVKTTDTNIVVTEPEDLHIIEDLEAVDLSEDLEGNNAEEITFDLTL